MSSKMLCNGQALITFVKLEPKTGRVCIALLLFQITKSQRNLISHPARFYKLACQKIRKWGHSAVDIKVFNKM